ncbi:MAG TPA: hypothetical protein VKR53_06760, partial [Puia sp.]|nr:hypothetical protein [Puia sp.]
MKQNTLLVLTLWVSSGISQNKIIVKSDLKFDYHHTSLNIFRNHVSLMKMILSNDSLVVSNLSDGEYSINYKDIYGNDRSIVNLFLQNGNTLKIDLN